MPCRTVSRHHDIADRATRREEMADGWRDIRLFSRFFAAVCCVIPGERHRYAILAASRSKSYEYLPDNVEPSRPGERWLRRVTFEDATNDANIRHCPYAIFFR